MENSEITMPLKSLEEFHWSFHKTVSANTAGNFVASALSAHVVLTMTACGAEGNTAQEMKQALKLQNFDIPVLEGFQILIKKFNGFNNVILKLANKIYISHTIPVKDTFKELMNTHFGSPSETVDFSDRAGAAALINKWCAQKTNEKILEIVEKNELSEDTAIVLLNAVYFKGDWAHKFDPSNTKDRPFHISKTEIKQVPTMYIKKNFHYKLFTTPKARCIFLPYQNDELYMMIIIPNQIDGLEEVEKEIDQIEFDLEEIRYKEMIELYLPKFKIQTSIFLNNILQELGMKEMFTSAANFNGMTDGLPSKIDQVKQEAFIEVNEEGSEAAAVTVSRKCRSIPPRPLTVKVNRPFLFQIIDSKKVTLFSGRVIDPSPESPLSDHFAKEEL